MPKDAAEQTGACITHDAGQTPSTRMRGNACLQGQSRETAPTCAALQVQLGVRLPHRQAVAAPAGVENEPRRT